MHPANVRNLDDIQEEERGSKTSRFAALLLASIAGASIVTAAVVMSRRGGAVQHAKTDPLAELVAAQKQAAPAPGKLETGEVSFPSILSDDDQPTTALAAVRDERGHLVPPEPPAPPAAPPSGAAERLPVVPLPVGELLGATPVITDPKDDLTALAATKSKLPDDTALSPPGMDGGFQLQVASFKDQADADRLVEDLRRRGHRAYRIAANVPDRGVWQRVRIGPFRTKYEAERYKDKLERTERISPFVVDPEKVKRAAERRAARLAARERKKQHARGIVVHDDD